MGGKAGALDSDHLHRGVYRSRMNEGTSHVNWDEVATNKAKIAEYKQRMMSQKQALGHMEIAKGSVKAGSYVNHG